MYDIINYNLKRDKRKNCIMVRDKMKIFSSVSLNQKATIAPFGK
jgi:hypothetical protein